MRKQRKWLIIAALLLVVSIFPHFGTAEGDIQVQAEEEAGKSAEDTAAVNADSDSAAAADTSAVEEAPQDAAADGNSGTRLPRAK